MGCWEDIEFCEFAPVSIVDQATVFIHPVKPRRDVPVQVTIIFFSYSTSFVDIMCSQCSRIYRQ